MSRQKLRVKNTQLDNLIANLRGEVGEVVTSSVLLRHMMAKERELSSDDIAKDMANENLTFVNLLRSKLSDEIVVRLSELAEPKIGRLTFHFSAQTKNNSVQKHHAALPYERVAAFLKVLRASNSG